MSMDLSHTYCRTALVLACPGLSEIVQSDVPRPRPSEELVVILLLEREDCTSSSVGTHLCPRRIRGNQYFLVAAWLGDTGSMRGIVGNLQSSAQL